MRTVMRVMAIGLTLGFCGILPAAAMPIDKTLTIRVFQLCSDSGSNCAALGPIGDPYYATATNTIWAQAGIRISYDFVGQINSTFYSNIDEGAGNSFETLTATYDLANQASLTVVDMFLVHNIVNAYGEGWWGAGGLVMAMDSILSFNSGNNGLGRLDTMAHELGHNLGLEPTILGGDGGGHVPSNGVDNQLLSAGGYRHVPGSLADIAPNGLGYDLLTPDEIAYARTSSLLSDIPEPASLMLVILGISVTGWLRRRQPGSRSVIA